MKLKCSVWTDGRCGHTVKWLKEGSHTEVMTSHVCSASFSIKKDHYESLTCEVIDSQSGESHQFPFRRPQSGEKMMSCLKSHVDDHSKDLFIFHLLNHIVL